MAERPVRHEPESAGTEHRVAESAVAVPARWPAYRAYVYGAFASGVIFVSSPYAAVAGTVLVAAVAIVALCLGRTSKRPLAILSGWLTPPALVVLVTLWGSGTLGDVFLSQAFDAPTWRAQHETRSRTRLRMVEDLRTSGRLDGRSRDDVVALLGEPDRSPFGVEDGVLHWRLAPMWVDHWWLRVQFGPDGRVAAHEVVND